MAQSILKYGFSAGELSPNMYGRLDLEKYALGAELIRNFYVDYRGGISNRPGTRFIVEASNSTEDYVRLLPFIFSQNEGYLLEFTPFQIKVFLLGVLIDTVVSPWDGNEIWDLRYTQSADVMTIDHPDHMPYDLRRTTLATFELVEQTFGPEIGTPTNLSADANVGGNMRYAYCVTAIDANGQESLQTVPVAVTSAPLDPTSDSPKTIALEWTGVAGAVAYNIYKVGPVPSTRVISSLMGYIGQTTITKFTDTNIAPDFSRTPPIFRDPFAGGQITSITVTAGGAGYSTFTPCTLGDGDDGHGYLIADNGGAVVGVVILNPGKNNTVASVTPIGGGGGATFSGTVDENHYKPATVSYFQQRRVHGGSYAAPELLELSQISAYLNFDYSAALLDSDAITVSVASREVNQIKHFVPMSTGLVVMTSGGAFLVTGGQGEGSPVTPTSISALPQAATGSGDLAPIVVNYNIIFQQAMGSIVRDMAFNFQTQSYYGTDRSMLANHLFNGYVLTDWAFAEEPHKLLWVCRDDGKALTMTYVPDQEVYAWARHDTNGLFKSVCSVPEGHINAIYFVVRRYVEGEWRNYIERLMSEPFDCVQDAWFLDCAVKYNGGVGESEIQITYNGENVVNIEGFTFLVDNIQPPDLQFSQGAPSGSLSLLVDRTVAIDWQRRRIFETGLGGNLVRLWNLDTFVIMNTSTDVGGDPEAPVIGPATGNYYSCTGTRVYSHDPNTLLRTGSFVLGDVQWVDGHPANAASANTPFGVKEYICVWDNGNDIRIGNLTNMVTTGFSFDPGGTMRSIMAAPEEDSKAVFFLTTGSGSGFSLAGPKTYKLTVERTLSSDTVVNTPLQNITPQACGLLFFNGFGGACLDQEDSNIITIVSTGPAAAYNSGTTYALNNLVSSGGIAYKSLQAGNLNHTPASSPTWWEALGPNPTQTCFLAKYDPVTGVVKWVVNVGVNLSQQGLFALSRIRYGMIGFQASLGSSQYRVSILNTRTGAVIDQATHTNFNFEDQAYDDYWGDLMGKGDNASPGVPAENPPPSSWIDRFMRFKMGGNPVIPNTILVNCGVLAPTGYDEETGLLQANVVHPFFGVLANDPENTVAPIPAGGWYQGDPIDEIEVAHLIGKTVGMVADGSVYAEQVVPESGLVPVNPPASWVICGLPYQSQMRTLRLEAGELTVQGRRKLVSAVTARVVLTRGLKFGTNFAYNMYEYKDLEIEFSVPQQLYTGDQRIALDATWAEEGYICVQQDYPMPATVVGLIPEVVFGDNQR